ncbi:MAG: hypothetical protein C4584_01245 [Armatimonadetes bacterium]|nr:MAG: hypothetical protein C4584_01245 [Armatimonadota bacterium]
MSYFYSHLIGIEIIIIALDELNLSDKHKEHLAALIDSTIHQAVLSIIFAKLDPKDRWIFIEKFQADMADKELMNFLSDKIDNIETEITMVVEELKMDLLEDIKEAKKHG